MASFLGTHVPVDCPVCSEEVKIPIREMGVTNNVITVGLNMAPLHEHVANGHQSTQEAP
ncbi:hypothetical protein AB0958_18775 [Streptomyces sp. NPDC006655]|uniref:hypothetical protein n=1 Tax=Streptomyces sp. NPDC006655 TaxID=3156898 RepID=UPI0034559927